jgi:hypothetical protein
MPPCQPVFRIEPAKSPEPIRNKWIVTNSYLV